MAKQDAELLTMSRCRRMLMTHDYDARQRILTWLLTATHERASHEAPSVPKASDPRQLSISDALSGAGLSAA